MRCRECGWENPPANTRCSRCGAPMPGARQMERKQEAPARGQDRSKRLVLIVILALAVLLCAVLGAYALQNQHTARRIGMGGGGAMAPNRASSEELVTLDSRDSDIELYSFETDVYDILVGEEKVVSFTAEVFSNVSMDGVSVVVTDIANVPLGTMNDDGTDGDAAAGDGIYTLQVPMSSNEKKLVTYHAKAGDQISQPVTICFYRPYTDQELEEYEAVVALLNEAAAPHLDENGFLKEGDASAAMQAVASKLQELRGSGKITEYTKNQDSFSVVMPSGFPFVYEIRAKGLDGGAITTYQPFKNTYSDAQVNQLSDEATDGSASLIARELREYKFREDRSGRDDNFDLDEVTIASLRGFSSEQGVVLWHGHGGYNAVNGSEVATGEKQSRQSLKNYSADIDSGRLIPVNAAKRNVYAITGGFVDRYFGSMDNSFVYLAACSSARDMISPPSGQRYQLAQAFLNKGAAVVIGNNQSISTAYNTIVMRDTMRRMTERNEEETLYTVSEALSFAKEHNGSQDEGGATPDIYPRNSAAASGYRLRSVEGYVSGVVKNAETGSPVLRALVRVYHEGAYFCRVRTDENGSYHLALPPGEYVIKVDAGRFQSAKEGVTVIANSTAYTETLLMTLAGLTQGYGNGTITNALTGQGEAGVTLRLRKNWENWSGPVVSTASTNENGYYELELVPGLYTMEYSKEGFITGYKNIYIGPFHFEGQNASISPVLPDDGEIRITLSWREVPLDLDSHLTGPAPEGGRFHLFFPEANENGGHEDMDYYQLDLDNTDIVERPGVFETTTLLKQTEGVYRYSVHDYTNGATGENRSSSDLSQSNAVVNVYRGAVQLASYHVPANVRGTIWTVFELNGDQIIPINQMGAGAADDASKF